MNEIKWNEYKLLNNLYNEYEINKKITTTNDKFVITNDK